MTQPTAAVAKLADRNDNLQIGDRGASVTAVTGTAGATYTATEQAMINNLKTAVNALIERLEAHGLVADN
jgi:hypothetical protein